MGSGSGNVQASFTTNAQATALIQRYAKAAGSGTSQGQAGMPFDHINQQQTKHARRLYVGGIPPETTDDELGDFFSDIIVRAIISQQPQEEAGAAGPAIVSIYINHEKCFAFVELKSIELTTACLGLDGIKYQHRGGSAVLRIRRPNDFKPELLPSSLRPTPALNLAVLGIVGTTVSDGPGKVFVGGLPYNLTDDNVKELLSVFGPLKSFHLVRDAGSPTSKGYAFCEYYDSQITDIAISGLNGMQIGEKTLTVRIATQPGMSQPMLQPPPAAASAPIALVGPPTRVLKLSNMVSPSELDSDSEYMDILDDVRHECGAHGQVEQVMAPRYKEGFSSQGAIYVCFAAPSMARAAAVALHGRRFSERDVVVEYYQEELFAHRVL